MKLDLVEVEPPRLMTKVCDKHDLVAVLCGLECPYCGRASISAYE